MGITDKLKDFILPEENEQEELELTKEEASALSQYEQAKVEGKTEVTCWGDGSPLREFLYVDDLANLCVFKYYRQYKYCAV